LGWDFSESGLGAVNHEGSEYGTAEGGGFDRRTLIKRAAVAGAVAWTAPVIIDSLSSPAAATTAPRGCNSTEYNINCQPDNNAANAACAPTGFATCTNDLPTACIVAPAFGTCDGSPANGSVTFSISPACSCTFTGAAAHATNAGDANGCVFLVVASGAKTVTFPVLPAGTPQPQYNQFRFTLDCG
jgi:hypothetical protein